VPTTTATTTDHHQVLERRLGPFDAAAIIVANVIGGGILFRSPAVAAAVPDAPWFLLAWAGGGVLAFMGAMAIVMWAIPRQLVTLFLNDVPANAMVIGLAVSFLRVAAAFQLVDGAQVIGAGMLRGLHDTRWPLLFALFGYWVVGLGIGAWLAFARDWKGVGIWIGLASGLAAVAALMLARWMMRDRLGLARPEHA